MIGEGFAFFRWHSMKWGWLQSKCRYNDHVDVCADLWDRLRRHHVTGHAATPRALRVRQPSVSLASPPRGLEALAQGDRRKDRGAVVNAALKQICSCTWITTHDMPARHFADPLCSVHGEDAQTMARRRLIKDREGAALAVQLHKTEVRVWLATLRHSKRRLAELNKKLETL